MERQELALENITFVFLGNKQVRIKVYNTQKQQLSIETAGCGNAYLWECAKLQLFYYSAHTTEETQDLAARHGSKFAQEVLQRNYQKRVILRDMTKLLLIKLLQGELFTTTKPEEAPVDNFGQLSLF